MINYEFLHTVAEVGAAFAGFSTLVSVVGLRADRAVNVARVVSMLALSITAVFFALLPSLFEVYGYTDLRAWEVMSAIYAVAWGSYWVVMFVSVLRSRFVVSFGELPAIHRINTVIVHPLALIVLGCSAFGLWGTAVVAVYVTLLLLMLSLSGLLFIQTVISIIGPLPPSQDVEPD